MFLNWIVQAICQAYGVRGIPSPLGIRAQITMAVTTSVALLLRVSLQDVCDAADCASSHTFIMLLIAH